MMNLSESTRNACRCVALVAGKELRDCWRGRWLQFGSGLFAFLSLALFFGTAALGGQMHYPELSSLLNSLVTLTVFLLPLLAVLLGYDAFVGEAEAGTLLLMLTYPIGRTQWLLGKLIGQSAALVVCLTAGVAVLPLAALVAPVSYSAADVLAGLVPVVFSGTLLGIIFILASYWVSLLVTHKSQALAFLFFVWLTLVLLYDLMLIVVSVASDGALDRSTLTALLLANPATVFRLFNQNLLSGGPQVTVPGGVLLAILVLWCAVLAGGCREALRRLSF